MTDTDNLTGQLQDALRTPGVSLALSRNWLGGQSLITVTVPGPTPRAKRVQPVPVIVGNPGQTHADMLRAITVLLEQD